GRRRRMKIPAKLNHAAKTARTVHPWSWATVTGRASHDPRRSGARTVPAKALEGARHLQWTVEGRGARSKVPDTFNGRSRVGGPERRCQTPSTDGRGAVGAR